MLDAFNLEGINLSPNLKKTIKLITHFKLIIFLLFSILQSMWNLKVIDEQTFVVRWHSKEVEGKPKIKYTAKLLTGSLKPLPRWVYQYFPDGSKIVEEIESSRSCDLETNLFNFLSEIRNEIDLTDR